MTSARSLRLRVRVRIRVRIRVRVRVRVRYRVRIRVRVRVRSGLAGQEEKSSVIPAINLKTVPDTQSFT